METHRNLPLRSFASQDEWRYWLKNNHSLTTGVWLKFAKRGSNITTVTYEEARNTSIAYGWIDGLVNKHDEAYYLIRFTPRKPKSGWSKINCEIAEMLIASQTMHPSGLAHVEAAKGDGRWDLAYDPPSKMTVPHDFQQDLDHNRKAGASFAALSAADRYAFLHRLQTAKTPGQRATRLKKFIAMLEDVAEAAKRGAIE